MSSDTFEKRKKIKIFVAVLAVGLTMSLLVALALIYLGQRNPSF